MRSPKWSSRESRPTCRCTRKSSTTRRFRRVARTFTIWSGDWDCARRFGRVSGFWQFSFELGARDPDGVEEGCFELGATSVTYVDAYDDPVLEPLPGEFRLWPTTRLRALFPDETDAQAVGEALAATLGIPPGGLKT